MLEDKEQLLANIIEDLGLPKNEAKMLAFIAGAGKVSTKDIRECYWLSNARNLQGD